MEPPLDAVTLRAVEPLLQLPSLPEVLGREVMSMLVRAGCILDARLASAGPDDPEAGSPSEGEDGWLAIALGSFLGRRFRVDARPRPGVEALETFVTIRRLVEASVRAHQMQSRDAARTSLWRFESISTDGAPLVVSGLMQRVLVMIHQLAASDAPVLLTGETGTGKEVFARELHRASKRRGAFVPFNCTAVAADMLDAQLFGHRRGAFTGATENFQGIVRSAADGTLFLDEIAELGLELQPKLLRLVDRYEVHPLGEPHPVSVRVRLVAATNANLEASMAAGRFREDLFYRLNVGRVHIPPLRERREEIPSLADLFLETYARDGQRARLTLADDALEALLLYRWPGNVRQLASEMRRLVALCKPGTIVRADVLAPDIRQNRRATDDRMPAVPPDFVAIRLDQPLDAAVEALERALLRYAFEAEGGHVERTAARLAISRKGLFLKRRRLGLEP
jgi:DNA-binding NtrC family response regulator